MIERTDRGKLVGIIRGMNPFQTTMEYRDVKSILENDDEEFKRNLWNEFTKNLDYLFGYIGSDIRKAYVLQYYLLKWGEKIESQPQSASL